ncbi:MAG: guanylate kinase [Bacilli bacterium]|nr:guanylate kinase [Bacilli bacterium]
MIREKSKGLLIVISGPSGAGKGTIVNRLVEDMKDTKISISMTSRAPRGKEVDGVEYYFVSKEEFEERIANDEFLEYAVVHNNQYYGTPKAKIDEDLSKGKNVILEIDIQGALKVKEKVSEALFIFIMPPSMEELKNRLIKRNTETKDKILERFKTAYNEINEFTKYNYVVVNDRVEKAVDKVKSIITAEKCRVDRIEEIYLNTKEEFIHEGLIDEEFENKELEI